MDEYSTVIEIGSFSIKTIIFSNINSSPNIEGIGKVNTQGFNGNDIGNRIGKWVMNNKGKRKVVIDR